MFFFLFLLEVQGVVQGREEEIDEVDLKSGKGVGQEIKIKLPEIKQNQRMKSLIKMRKRSQKKTT